MRIEKVKEIEFSTLKVWCLPCFEDNYVFIIHCDISQFTVVVDPGDSRTVENFLKYKKFDLNEIWVTHHHVDHVAGVKELAEKYSCIVRGSIKIENRIPSVTTPVDEHSSWNLNNFNVKVIELPGHTIDHIAFWLANENDSILFSGDVLFGLGCGRIFEGTYEQMALSLIKISKLPLKTKIFCAHEYTEKNLNFSLSLVSDDKELLLRKEKILKSSLLSEPTVPLDLEEELNTNLFLKSIQDGKSIEHFKEIREKRNLF